MSRDLPPAVLGVHVSGWSAFVLDVLLRKHAGSCLAAMSPGQRLELERTRAAVHLAALHWQATSVDRSGEVTAAVTGRGLAHDEITNAQAAGLLNVSECRMCQLAVGWADHGLAHKVT